MRISDWSSDVCSSDLRRILLELPEGRRHAGIGGLEPHELDDVLGADAAVGVEGHRAVGIEAAVGADGMIVELEEAENRGVGRSEESRVGKEWVRTCRLRG